jgi:hypothetical protein
VASSADGSKLVAANDFGDSGNGGQIYTGVPLGDMLTITHSGNIVKVSWPNPGGVLQQNPSLSTTNWTTLGYTGTNNFITNMSPGNMFYRLTGQ